MEIEFSLLAAQKPRCKIKRTHRILSPTLQVLMKPLQNFEKSKISSLIQKSIRILGRKFLRVFYFMALQEQVRHCSLAQLQEKRMFLSIQFLDLSLLKCLLVLVHHAFVIYLLRQKKMLLRLSSSMKLMQLVANVVPGWVAAMMSANKLSINY